MSLQTPANVAAAVVPFRDLWRDWLQPAGAIPYPNVTPMGVMSREMQRRNLFMAATQAFIPNGFPAGVPNITINYGAAGGWGFYQGNNWSLTIDSQYFSQDAITYSDFRELASTAYHEVRHAEQDYRSAQGLALGLANGGFNPPAMGNAAVVQMGANAGDFGGGFAAIQAAFNGNPMQNAVTRQAVIQNLLGIQANVVQHADFNQMDFANNFVTLPVPGWFTRATSRLEAEEWMRCSAARTLAGMNAWAQGPNAPYAFYANLPVEHDAHNIENGFQADLNTAITAMNPALPAPAANAAQPRTNALVFGP
ncbi:MAG: hypothetical protein AAFN77_24400 [Planctomycetota bacterium]